jgi:hypothetical protein
VSAFPSKGTDDYATFEGDAKWYFEDVAVTSPKYRLQFDYQPRTWAREATVRYTLQDGTYRYEQLSTLPLITHGGHGYQPWQSADLSIAPPADAVSFTVFFSATGKQGSESDRGGPNWWTLNIANVTLDAEVDDSALLDQIAGLESQIAAIEELLGQLRAQVAELKSRL